VDRDIRSDDIDVIAALAAELAEEAAGRVRDAAGSDLAVGSKSTSTDLVTDVDRAVERWLVQQLRARRPDDAVLGEEGGDRPAQRSSGVRWVLDPIDGTVNFVLGLPQFAVSVAAEKDGVVVAGAVANPMTGEIFRAARGSGAFCGPHRLGGPRDVPRTTLRCERGRSMSWRRCCRGSPTSGGSAPPRSTCASSLPGGSTPTSRPA
jgi:myo-inositol-1(or 4)-monophosphatase